MLIEQYETCVHENDIDLTTTKLMSLFTGRRDSARPREGQQAEAKKGPDEAHGVVRDCD